MPAGFWDSTVKNLFRAVLATETDAESGIPEVTYAQLRKWLEFLTLLNFGTGVWGTATGVSGDTLTDSAKAWDVDVHNGRTLIMLSGLAVGNIYTVDDTTATTLVCTGDDLEADGVAVDDQYAILYDILNRNQGHDHNDVNSPYVVLADGQVIEAKLAASSVSQAKLKTAEHEQSHTGNTAWTWKQLLYTEYRFGLQIYVTESPYDAYLAYPDCDVPFPTLNTTYTPEYVMIRVSDMSKGVFLKYRYITSSGEVYWLWVLRDKATKKIVDIDACSDHCSFGLDDPAQRPHPFLNYDPDKHEIICINPTREQLAEIYAVKPPGKSLIEIVLNDYEIDEESQPEWPTMPATTQILHDDWFEAMISKQPVRVVKKIIPHPPMVQVRALKKKEL